MLQGKEIQLQPSSRTYQERPLRQPVVLGHVKLYEGQGTLVYRNEPTPVQARPKPLFAESTTKPDALTKEHVIARLSSVEEVPWSEVPASVVKEIILLAASERGKPAFLLDDTEMYRQRYDFLGGEKLTDLYRHTVRADEKGERNAVEFLNEQIGIETTGQDVAVAMRSTTRMNWDAIPKTAVRQVLELAAEELALPLEVISSETFRLTKFDVLGGKDLSGVIKHVKEKLPTKEKDMTTKLHEFLGIETTIESIIAKFAHNKPVNWDAVPTSVKRKLLEKAAEELGTSASMLGIDMVRHEFAFLGSHDLGGLYANAQLSETRGDKGVLEHLYDQLDIRPTADEVIQAINDGRIVYWERIPSDVVHSLLQKAGDEIGVPASILGFSDLQNTQFTFLGEHSLKGLLTYTQNNAQDKDKPVVDVLLEQANIQITTDALIQAMQKKRNIPWRRLPQTALKELLERAAEEIGIPPAYLSSVDLRRKFTFLDDATLGGLFSFFNAKADLADRPTMDLIFSEAGLSETTDLDVSEALKKNKKINWEEVTSEALANILEQAAEELGRPVASLNSKDFIEQKYVFLGGKTLGRLHRHFNQQAIEHNQGTLSFIREQAGIHLTVDDVIYMIKAGKSIRWGEVPEDAISSLMERAADELQIPISAFGVDTFYTRLQFLDDRSIDGIYQHFNKRVRPEGKSTIAYIKEFVDAHPTAEDIIGKMSANKNVKWANVSPAVIATLLQRAAAELDLQVGMLSSFDLANNNFAFLGERSLSGLMNYCNQQKDDTNETAINFLKRSAGIVRTPKEAKSTVQKERVRKSRKVFRKMQMEALFRRFIREQQSDALDPADLLPWMDKVAQLYKNPFIGLSIEEMKNEAYVYIAEKVQEGSTIDITLVSELFSHLEMYRSQETSKRYKEKSLATRIKDTDLTIGDMLEDVSHDAVPEQVVFTPAMEQALRVLSPLQRELLMGITVHEQTFEELTGEINSKYGLQADTDTLQEHYDEALLIMRGQLGEKQQSPPEQQQ